jgi:hypothetical protein
MSFFTSLIARHFSTTHRPQDLTTDLRSPDQGLSHDIGLEQIRDKKFQSTLTPSSTHQHITRLHTAFKRTAHVLTGAMPVPYVEFNPLSEDIRLISE